MINRKVALLRILTCAIGGSVFALLLLNFVPFALRTDTFAMAHKSAIEYSEYHAWNPDAMLYAMASPFSSLLAIVGIGAFLGLLPGIAWAIDQKSARRRFLLWSVLGLVIGFILMVATDRVTPMIVFPVAGVYAGGVSALNRLGAFEAKDQRTE